MQNVEERFGIVKFLASYSWKTTHHEIISLSGHTPSFVTMELLVHLRCCFSRLFTRNLGLRVHERVLGWCWCTPNKMFAWFIGGWDLRENTAEISEIDSQ